MKKLLLVSIFFTLAITVPLLTMAADADAPKDSQTGGDEKQQDERLETGKPTGPENKSNWQINVMPVPDNMKTPPEKKQDRVNIPPDRF